MTAAVEVYRPTPEVERNTSYRYYLHQVQLACNRGRWYAVNQVRADSTECKVRMTRSEWQPTALWSWSDRRESAIIGQSQVPPADAVKIASRLAPRCVNCRVSTVFRVRYEGRATSALR